MRTRLLAAAAVATAATLLALAGAGHFAGPDVARAVGGTPVNVGAYGCIVLSGGQRTVPAGSEIVISSGWISGTSGAVRSFLEAQVTLVSVNDGAMVDASGGYSPPAADGTNSISRLSYPTNVTLANPGDSMRFTFALVLDRAVTDVFDVDGDGTPDPQTGAGLLFGGTCTVTAA